MEFLVSFMIDSEWGSNFVQQFRVFTKVVVNFFEIIVDGIEGVPHGYLKFSQSV